MRYGGNFDGNQDVSDEVSAARLAITSRMGLQTSPLLAELQRAQHAAYAAVRRVRRVRP